MMIVNQIVSTRRHYRAMRSGPSPREMLRNTVNAIPALLLPVIILAEFVRVFSRRLRHRWSRSSMRSCAVRSSSFVALEKRADDSVALCDSDRFGALIVAASAAFAWVLTIENVPQSLAGWITSLNVGPLELLLLINVLC